MYVCHYEVAISKKLKHTKEIISIDVTLDFYLEDQLEQFLYLFSIYNSIITLYKKK